MGKGGCKVKGGKRKMAGGQTRKFCANMKVMINVNSKGESKGEKMWLILQQQHRFVECWRMISRFMSYYTKQIPKIQLAFPYN